ncbi:MAG: acyl-CoA dehydrogenase family protein [Jatrophihabitans sp.]
MTLIARISEVIHPTANELAPTAAELIARAEAMAPELVGLQSETETRGSYSEDTHQEFSRAGFYRILVPRRYGGYQLGADTFFRVSMALARGCPSTALMYCRSTIHAITVAGLFGEQAQSELFGHGEFIAPATLVPGGTAEPTAEGGWLLNGIWADCSGSSYASHFIGHLMVAGNMGGSASPMMFVAPRAEWSRLEGGKDQLGLRGRGAHGIAITAGRIPSYFALQGTQLSGVATVEEGWGRTLHDDAEYSGNPFSYLGLEMASLAVGIARGALDAYEEVMRSRHTLVPPVVDRVRDPDYQHWYGEAIGLIATAESATLEAIRQWREACIEHGSPDTHETELRIAAICRQVTQLCWHAVEHYLFASAGTSAASHGGRLERIWRDLSMLHSRGGLSTSMSTIASRNLARARLGLG